MSQLNDCGSSRHRKKAIGCPQAQDSVPYGSKIIAENNFVWLCFKEVVQAACSVYSKTVEGFGKLVVLLVVVVLSKTDTFRWYLQKSENTT